MTAKVFSAEDLNWGELSLYDTELAKLHIKKYGFVYIVVDTNTVMAIEDVDYLLASFKE